MAVVTVLCTNSVATIMFPGRVGVNDAIMLKFKDIIHL
jgi:hypothetical protein